MRHASDALITGIGTMLADDPRLTDRSGLPRRRPLLRVIVDSKLRLPLRSQIVRSANNDLLVFTTLAENHTRAQRLRAAGVEIVHVAGREGRVNLADALRELGRREITSVILEAGSALNGVALAAGVVDKVVLFYAPHISGRTDVPFAAGGAKLPEMRITCVRRFGPDVCVEGIIRDPYSKSHRRSR
jgi:diaminohydroxyphosphoribosylaminopyrimidine deaminase/5-amino-6-(5-phosphoribosylamino)uracil reductase